MAIDAALLGRAEPTVRLYGWAPGCVSLGRGQAPAAVDGQALRAFDLDLVKRPTGGGAILHEPSEVTYTVVLPWNRPDLPRDLFASYKFLARPVVEFLALLGLGATFEEGRGGDDPFCYMRQAGVSIAIEGRRISGGAQRRTKDAVLQHGTVVVDRDAEMLSRLFAHDPLAIEDSTTSLRAEGVTLDRHRIVELLSQAFVRHLGARDLSLAGPEAVDALDLEPDLNPSARAI